MTDSQTITYGKNFLAAVVDGVYESTQLPDVMNLLERSDVGSTALHYCAQSGYFLTLMKILECSHPAVGLLVVSKNYQNMTALDLLLQNKNLSELGLKTILVNMQKRCFLSSFVEMLESSLKHMESLDDQFDQELKPLVEEYYVQITQPIFIMQSSSYTPTYAQQKVTDTSSLLPPHDQDAVKNKNLLLPSLVIK